MLTPLIVLWTSPPASASCPNPVAPYRLADVQDASLNEISGIAPSRRTGTLFWSHQDSGDGPRVYAIDRGGASVATYDVTGATATDWEDMASTREDGERWLYIADIGDNAYNRAQVTVWRVPEPVVDLLYPTDGATAQAERIDLTWPNGPRNAETLLVDAAFDELVIVTKDSNGISDVMVAPTATGAHVLQYAGTLDLGSWQALNLQTTGGDVAPNRSGALIRTYADAFYWPLTAGVSVATTLVTDTPCTIPIAGEQQGEAITFNRRSAAIITMSEGTNEPIWRVQLR